MKNLAFELDHKPDHIAKFINQALSIVDTVDFNEYENKLVGENNIIEIVETHIVSRRDETSRILTGERYWVI